jgi:chitinase
LRGDPLLEAVAALSNHMKKLYCCPKDEADEWENCKWYGKPGSCHDNRCPTGHSVRLTSSPYGLGEDCFPRVERDRVFCCDPAHGKGPFLPVPLSELFPNMPERDDNGDTDYELLTDDTWGTGKSKTGGNDDPNDAAFSFVVLTSPEEIQVSLDKRDGSHWELFNCDPTNDSEEERTVQMVCTDVSDDSNCGKISLGDGVPGTILQMPPGCSAGKYAVAKHMKPAKKQLLPRSLDHLAHKPVVYDLTFDHDFSRVPRGLGNTQLRIDFSNQKGYWDNIVAADVNNKRRKRSKSKRSLDDVGGNHARWLEHEFRDDQVGVDHGSLSRRELEERWFGEGALDWLRNMIKPEIKKDFTHDIDETVTAKIVDEKWACPGREGHILAQAQANIKVSTSFGFTLIATSLFPFDIRDSYLVFTNKGEIKCTFTLDALARFTYDTGEKPIIEIPFPGATLRIPGIATIGPALAVKGRIEAELALAAELEARLDVVSWEYDYRLPAISEVPPVNPDAADYGRTGDQNGLLVPTFYAGVQATGNVKAHLLASLQFGVNIDDRWKMGKATAEVTADGWAEVKVAAGASTEATCPFTWGLTAGVDLYAQAQGFKWATGKYTLPGTATFPIYPGGQCPDLRTSPARRDLPPAPDSIDPAAVGSISNTSISTSTSSLGHPRLDDRALQKRAIGPFVRIPAGKLICPSIPQGADDPSACASISGWEPDQIQNAMRRRDHLDFGTMTEPTATENATAHRDQPHHHHQSLHQLERRVTDSSRSVTTCSGIKLYAPAYETSGTLPNVVTNLLVFDYAQPGTCNDFNFGVTSTPRATQFYATEHILELQVVADFFNVLNRHWGRDFIDYRPTADPTVKSKTLCDTLKTLWVGVRASDRFAMDGQLRDPMQHVMAPFPGNVANVDEFAFLEADVNTAKQKVSQIPGHPSCTPFSLTLLCTRRC